MKLTKLSLIACCLMATMGARTLLARNDVSQKSIVVMSMIGNTSNELQRYIAEHENVVLLFYGDQCPPCQRFKPIFNRVAILAEFENVAFVEISATQYAQIRQRYGVNKWPTVIFLKNGRELRRDVRRDDLSFISEETFKQHVRALVTAQ